MVSAKQVAAVAVALVVVVSVGSAVAFSSPADLSPRTASDDGDVVRADNETDNETAETVVGDNETDNGTVGDNVTGEVSVTFENQTSNGTAVVVANVTVPEGGFVAIHNDTLFEEGDAVGSVVGVSDYLEAGSHENVTVELFTNATFEDEELLVAMPHRDTNANESYEFVSSNGTDDGPYVADGAPVVDNATVTLEETVVGDNVTDDNVTDDNVTNVTDDNVTNVTDDNVTDDDITDDNVTEDNVTEDNVTNVTEDNVTEDNVTEDNVTEDGELTTIGQSFEVTSMEMPSAVQTGETLVVEVTITNPNDVMASQFIELRFSGVLVQFGEVTLDAGESETLRLGVPISGLDNGLYVVSVLTSNDGEVRAVAVGGPPENVTNVTEPDNVTPPDNVTENVTNVTPTDNVTNVTDNVTNVTENVTNVTEDNVTENVTNVTEDNVTNVTEDNVTEDNVTEDNVTEDNVTEDNVTEDNVTDDNVTVVENQSFRVTSLDAPESVAVGDEVTVNATIENPNDEEATQDVEFRVQGNIVERQSVTIDAGSSEELTFTLDTAGLPEGQYIHGVLTRDFGQVAILELTGDNVTDDNVTDGNVTDDNMTDDNVTAGNESGDVQRALEIRA